MKTINETELLRRVVSLMPLASTDETRYHLNGVRIRRGGSENTIELSVTDGHRLVVETYKVIDSTLADAIKDKEFLIYKSDVAVFKLQLKEWGKIECIKLNAVIDGNRLNITINRHNMVSLSSIENYPKIEPLLKTKAPTMTIGFNAKLLAEMTKALKTGRHDIVKLEIRDKVSPIVVSCGGNDARSVLMPCRL